MPRTYTAAALAIATTDTNIPIDLDGLIVSAAAGNALARSFLRPVVLRIALEEAPPTSTRPSASPSASSSFSAIHTTDRVSHCPVAPWPGSTS